MANLPDFRYIIHLSVKNQDLFALFENELSLYFDSYQEDIHRFPRF
ncbi:hypothetical protein LEP1GSC058_1982 [Leptospira fainei serovar Hurstbridge str. BUT 6]|uniref:Uncharacterized protein n=1 Tax=Leptospira fainei serovar Hurstbridge str. BUT 6 TaxID=1193011 RepID=S3UYA7_9LEPT|nr:hypothetical protein LEP1GSC058_1982 [Leptospira fainei serovar Hurstbridge str. BUT 6]